MGQSIAGLRRLLQIIVRWHCSLLWNWHCLLFPPWTPLLSTTGKTLHGLCPQKAYHLSEEKKQWNHIYTDIYINARLNYMDIKSTMEAYMNSKTAKGLLPTGVQWSLPGQRPMTPFPEALASWPHASYHSPRLRDSPRENSLSAISTD